MLTTLSHHAFILPGLRVLRYTATFPHPFCAESNNSVTLSNNAQKAKWDSQGVNVWRRTPTWEMGA